MHGALNPNSNVDRLYIPRKYGGRGMIGIVDCIIQEKNSLKGHVNTSTEPMLKEVGMQGILDIEGCKNPKTLKKEIKQYHMEGWKEKSLHGKMVQEVEEFMDEEKTWMWLRKGTLKKETESTICAAQEQAIRTNAIKKHIDKKRNIRNV